MWAYALRAPREFVRVEVPTLTEADLGPGEVLLRATAGAVCGSDLPVFKGHESLARPDGGARAAEIPGYPMHEIVGEVVASREDSLAVGTAVVGWATRHRGLAELSITAGSAVHPYHRALDPVQAVQLQTLACVLDSVDRCPPIGPATRAAVLGLGPIGLLFAKVLADRGAGAVVGVDLVDRSDLGDRFGIGEVVHSSVERWVAHLSEQQRPDLVVEAIGHHSETVTHAIRACAPRGFVNVFGVPDVEVYPVPINLMLRKNVTMFAGYVDDRRRWLSAADDLLRERPDFLDGYLTEVFGLAEANQAYTAAATPRAGQVKVAIDFSR